MVGIWMGHGAGGDDGSVWEREGLLLPSLSLMPASILDPLVGVGMMGWRMGWGMRRMG